MDKFKGGHAKAAKEFQKISQKRVNKGWVLHSFSTNGGGSTMMHTFVWQRDS